MVAAAMLPRAARYSIRWVVPLAALQPAGSRTIVHIPAMVWGAAKLGALVGGSAVTKKHVAVGLTKKFVQHVGVRRAIQLIADLNDGLLASGAHSQAVHETVATSLRGLENQLVSLGQSSNVRALEMWLAELEKNAPELAVAVGKMYLESFAPVKAAKAVMKGVPRGASELTPASEVAGLTQREWQAKVHEAFPELRDYHVLFLPADDKRKGSES
jgi:hypothetical protein